MKKNHKKRKLVRNKIVVPLTLAAIFSCLIMVFVFTNLIKQSEDSKIKGKLKLTQEMIDNVLQKKIQSLITQNKNFTQSNISQEAIKLQDPEILQKIANLTTTSSEFNFIEIIDPQGKLILNTYQPEQKKPILKVNYQQEPTNQGYLLNSIEENLQIQYYRKIYLNDEFLGIVTTNLKLNQELTGQLKKATKLDFLLVHNNKNLAPTQLTQQALNNKNNTFDLTKLKNNQLKKSQEIQTLFKEIFKWRHLIQTPILPLLNWWQEPLTQKIFWGQSGQTLKRTFGKIDYDLKTIIFNLFSGEDLLNDPSKAVFSTAELNQNKYHLGFYPLQIGNDLIHLGIMAAGLTPTQINQNRITKFSIILIIATQLTVVLYVMKGITKPIQIMTKTMEKVARGNLNAKSNIKTKDEIGYLSYQFDLMVDQVRNIYEREKSLSASKSEFISTAAHQLRTPLTAVRWSLDLMFQTTKENKITPMQTEILTESHKNILRVNQMVNQLLDLSRLEAGNQNFEIEPLKINQIISTIISESQTLIKKKELKVELTDLDQGRMLADKTQIKIVIQNLIENAIHYSPEKSTIKLNVFYNQTQQQAIISIKDQGVGIPESHRLKMFQKFKRAKNAVDQKTEGSGLGLYLTSEIINKHQGVIYFSSLENKGTTFYFTLPLA